MVLEFSFLKAYMMIIQIFLLYMCLPPMFQHFMRRGFFGHYRGFSGTGDDQERLYIRVLHGTIKRLPKGTN